MSQRIDRLPLSRDTRRVLWADAAVELVVAVALVGLTTSIDTWFGIEAPIARAGGAIFVAAAAALAIMAIAERTPATLVRIVAWTNIAGGAIAWLALLGSWSSVSPEGRWLAAAVADAFILLGVLELVVLRRSR